MNENRIVNVGDINFANHFPIVLIIGPCQIESLAHAKKMAGLINGICEDIGIKFLYKSSFDKANRTSGAAKRGVGMKKGLDILADIKAIYNCGIVTDVHETHQCDKVAEVADVLQIPSLLSRQTDLLTAAAKTNKVIHVKKGQFLAPNDVYNIVKKISIAGNEKILLCERGTSFGYNTLVNDMRAIPIMGKTGYPVIFDATHSVQSSGLTKYGNNSTGGDREMVPVLAKAAVAIGVAGIFLETHDDPDNAPSDGPNMVKVTELKKLLYSLKRLDDFVKSSQCF